MRIRIVQRPPISSIDGIQLNHFYPGFQYEVGTLIGELLLAEGWGEFVEDEQPALLVPFSEAEILPKPPADRRAIAGDSKRRKHRTAEHENRRAEEQIREELRDSRAKTVRGDSRARKKRR